MFENKIIKGYCHATRFIMSWIRAGGTLNVRGGSYGDFDNWLKSLGLSDEDIEPILILALNGKLELEVSARRFIEENNIK